ncbi:exosortase-associated EpsI family protein [Kiritimatiellaeota bacterium B1221]|nr:exosortase-associated EpsI family protein [Kiritimatiellaeota bacterium B1221]
MKKSGSIIHPYWVLGLLFCVTAALLLFTVDISVTDEAGVRQKLPDTLGDQWEGFDVLFCQDPGCGRNWLTRDVPLNDEGRRVCPSNWQGEPCGGELLTMSLGEKTVLPRDTVMMKKQYINRENPENTVFTSVVLSGKDRTSIHRPELCLDAQGNAIESSQALEIPLANGNTIKVQVLLLNKKYSEKYTRYSYYAYFFIGKDRTTHLHFERLLWMSLDRVFRNVAHRWAYIAVSGERAPLADNAVYQDEIRNVISKLYPEISLLENK